MGVREADKGEDGSGQWTGLGSLPTTITECPPAVKREGSDCRLVSLIPQPLSHTPPPVPHPPSHLSSLCAGASPRPEFQLPALYTTAARSTFLSNGGDGSYHHQRAPPGSRLIALLTGPLSGTGGGGTGNGSSLSVRSLSQQEDGLCILLDDLVGMGSAAVQVQGREGEQGLRLGSV